MKIKANKILLAWFLVSAVSSIVAAAVSMLYWEYTFVPVSNDSVWRPIDGFWEMFLVMPFGWIYFFFFPSGWLNLAGVGLALYLKSYKPLILSIIGALIFGAYWPEEFVAIMAV